MAQQENQRDKAIFCCSICLDPLTDPATIPCGHSYCMNCIKLHWDAEDSNHLYSCPQCRQTFTPRPDLLKNTMLADLVEELKKTGLQAAPDDHCYAGAEDVACDFCTERKLKAIKSCLKCAASYCETHLQPHYDSAAFRKHQLVEPSKKLQENICSRHDEVMKMFCRTDQQCICYLCSVEEHKGHDTVSAAAERSKRQRGLEGSRLNIRQRIQDREKDVKLLQQEAEAINDSADKAAEHSEKTFTELIRLMEKRRSEVKQQVRSQQETEVSRVKELQEELEQEITELKRKDAELKKISHTEDHNQFLHSYTSLSPLSPSTSSINIRPLRYFEDVTAAVSGVREKLQDVLTEKWTNVSLTGSDVGLEGRQGVSVPDPQKKKKKKKGIYRCWRGRAYMQDPEFYTTPLLTGTGVDIWTQPEPEPKSRAEFLKSSCQITLGLQDVLTEKCTNVSLKSSNVGLEGRQDVSVPDPRVRRAHTERKIRINRGWKGRAFVQGPGLFDFLKQPEPEPRTRADFLRYSCELTLDPNTAHTQLLLSEGNRRATFMTQQQSYSDHPDRFTDYWQVLSLESLTGRCYWEVEWRGRGGGTVSVAVANKNIRRAGWCCDCGFGQNDKSWALSCDNYDLWYNNDLSLSSAPVSSRVGVYLDHSAGILNFYSVSETMNMTLLHRVQTTFTQPLYAGLRFYDPFPYPEITAKFCKLK